MSFEHLVSNASPTDAARAALIFAAATVADVSATESARATAAQLLELGEALLIERIAAVRDAGTPMNVSPTVLDVSRAIAALDEYSGPIGHADNVRQPVARNLAYQFSRYNGWGGRKNVTTRDVRAAMIAHGAAAFTVERHAPAIAAMIRADFSDGHQYTEETRRQRPILVDDERHALDETTGERRFLRSSDFKPREEG